MSEKRLRFTMESDKLYSCIFDNGEELTCFELVDLLNEQQATIKKLQEENKELGKNFDDLVQWASEIAKRNVVLDEQVAELQRENEQLRKEHQKMLEKYLLLKLKIGEVLNDE